MVKRNFKATWVIVVILLTMVQFKSLSQIPERIMGCWTGMDGNLNQYADSLNFIHDPEHLPKFLDDYLIDWKLRDMPIGCLKDNDEGISIRASVLERVINENVLKWIVESKNVNYDKRYVPGELEKESNKNHMFNDFPVLPFMEYSIRDLAKDRLKKIEKTKNRFKKK